MYLSLSLSLFLCYSLRYFEPARVSGQPGKFLLSARESIPSSVKRGVDPLPLPSTPNVCLFYCVCLFSYVLVCVLVC